MWDMSEENPLDIDEIDLTQDADELQSATPSHARQFFVEPLPSVPLPLPFWILPLLALTCSS